jgi:branched-chain amino acid transport system substrate-binding protein
VSNQSRWITATALFTALTLTGAACSGDDDETGTTAATTAVEPGTDTTVAGVVATGEPFTIGVVNIEGAPTFDFPEFTDGFDAAAKYVNEQLGGAGGRPIVIEECIAQGTPESSQQCAQELAEKDVELVLVGLDIFTDYATYEAASIPVIGSIPILPPDYAAEAWYLTGGNLGVMTAITAVADRELGAKKVGILSSDNPAGNAGSDILEDALTKAGIEYTIVKGGDNETDAGYQGLMRQANEGDPDVLISLYAGPGCVGTIRARTALGIDTPVLSTGLCRNKDVIDVVGDEAVDWIFATGDDSGELFDVMTRAIADFKGIEPDEVNTGGFTVIGFLQMMTMYEAANDIAAANGAEALTGAAVYDEMKNSTNRTLWGGGQPYDCGQEPDYPSICTFGIQFSRFLPGGELELLADGEFIDGREYLP